VNRSLRLLLVCLLLAQPAPAATLDALDADGWYTWRVEAVEGGPEWCCVSWNRGRASPCACQLDGSHDGYGRLDGPESADGEVRLYARIESGRLARLRTLSPRCAVESRDRMTDLGLIDAGRSFDWLRRRVADDSAVSGDVLAAIAMHRGDAPLEFLVAAANGGADGELRENAIFWLGQVRIAEAAPVIERLMAADGSADIRRHAAFALAQSTYSARAAALVRQGRADEDPEVRSDAWFWLAQTGAGESEPAIMRAMLDDPDREVREEAVFALSQLPGDRAVDALLVLLEDRGMDRELRKAALFWLVQSDSDRAFMSVERLLVGSPAR
jgi:hypothetical protein